MWQPYKLWILALRLTDSVGDLVFVITGTAIDLTVPTAASADGDTSFEQEVAALRRQYGGREGLMSLALADLEKAVEIDSEGEDVQRQRDCLRKEIDEESVRARHWGPSLDESYPTFGACTLSRKRGTTTWLDMLQGEASGSTIPHGRLGKGRLPQEGATL